MNLKMVSSPHGGSICTPDKTPRKPTWKVKFEVKILGFRFEDDAKKTVQSRISNVIYEGDTVICDTNDDRMFFQVIAKNDTIKVGRKATSLKPVIGSSYGSVFELQNKKLVPVTGGLFPDPVAPETGECIVPSNDNRHYTDTNTAQQLSTNAIVALRDNGATGNEIIQQLVENSKTWNTKTEFSKQKYLKKKQQKYMPRIRFLKCTADSLCRTYRIKKPSRICSMREDTLGQMLMYGNVYAESQLLVVDTCMGLLIGAIAERQRGYGRILAAYEGQQPAFDLLRRFNFDKRTLESIHYFPFTSVELLSRNEKDILDNTPTGRDGLTPEQRALVIEKRVREYTPEEQAKYALKQIKRAENKLLRHPQSVIRDWIRAQSDGLLIASHFDPEAILMALIPYLKYSAPFVIYSEYLEPLTRLFAKLQQISWIIDLQLNETWTREYQVLPGRTHPDMKMNACSGYLLSGIKIHAGNVASTNDE